MEGKSRLPGLRQQLAAAEARVARGPAGDAVGWARARSDVDTLKREMAAQEEWENGGFERTRATEIHAALFPELGSLPRFEPKRRCPKCHGRARVQWRQDRLDRRCRRCGFMWTEAPLDSVDTEEPPAQPEG